MKMLQAFLCFTQHGLKVEFIK